MAIYLVKARPRKDLLENLQKQLNSGKISKITSSTFYRNIGNKGEKFFTRQISDIFSHKEKLPLTTSLFFIISKAIIVCHLQDVLIRRKQPFFFYKHDNALFALFHQFFPFAQPPKLILQHRVCLLISIFLVAYRN
jgi:hypothetical protein